MSTFKFRLARLLDLRHLLELEETRVLAAAARQADAAAELARAAALRHRESSDQLARALSGPAGLWAARLAAKHAIQAKAGDQAEDHRTALAKVEAKRAHLVESHRERNTIERLRERQHAAWLADESHTEQKALDEVGRHRSASPEEETTCN